MTTNNFESNVAEENPGTPVPTPSSESSRLPVDIPDDQRLDPTEYSINNAIVWQELIDGGRQYVTYRGTWCVDFLPGNRHKAMTWRDDRLNAGEHDFFENEYTSGVYQFVLNKEDSQHMLVSKGLRLDDLRNGYDNATEITPFFQDTPRYIPGQTTSYLTYHSLPEFEKDQRTQQDLLLFNDDTENRPDVLVKVDNDGQDVAAYYDKAGRLRIAYDAPMLYRAKQLLADLAKHGEEREYVLGRFPSGTVFFVLDKGLVERITRYYPSFNMMIRAWTDDSMSPEENIAEKYPTIFENTIDVVNGRLVDTLSLFGLSVNTEKK